MNNELMAMQTFLAVVEQQSFSAAARVLGVGQPSVSRRISDLEAHLETALLVRTTREVRPTEAGLRYYEAARTALAAVESARATARVEAAALTGTLRVGSGTLFADTWLAPRISAWLEEHPELRLEFELSDAYVDLVSSRLDVSLCFGGPDTAELRSVEGHGLQAIAGGAGEPGPGVSGLASARRHGEQGSPAALPGRGDRVAKRPWAFPGFDDSEVGGSKLVVDQCEGVEGREMFGQDLLQVRKSSSKLAPTGVSSGSRRARITLSGVVLQRQIGTYRELVATQPAVAPVKKRRGRG
jgi:hypothetical protein